MRLKYFTPVTVTGHQSLDKISATVRYESLTDCLLAYYFIYTDLYHFSSVLKWKVISSGLMVVNFHVNPLSMEMDHLLEVLVFSHTGKYRRFPFFIFLADFDISPSIFSTVLTKKIICSIDWLILLKAEQLQFLLWEGELWAWGKFHSIQLYFGRRHYSLVLQPCTQ